MKSNHLGSYPYILIPVANLSSLAPLRCFFEASSLRPGFLIITPTFHISSAWSYNPVSLVCNFSSTGRFSSYVIWPVAVLRPGCFGILSGCACLPFVLLVSSCLVLTFQLTPPTPGLASPILSRRGEVQSCLQPLLELIGACISQRIL